MSRIEKINVGGVDYDILPENGQEGQALVIHNGEASWGSVEVQWEEM